MKLAKLVPHTAAQARLRAILTGRTEEEAWTNANAIAQIYNIRQEMQKNTVNIVDKDYEISGVSMRNRSLNRDTALQNKNKREQVEIKTTQHHRVLHHCVWHLERSCASPSPSVSWLPSRAPSV
jgi:hypothetical protein